MRPLPSLDHIARALLMRGSRDAAIALLEAATARGGDDKARCEILLAALRARPTDRVSGPPITLDADLVEELASTGRIREARAVASGIDIGRTALGVEIARALDHVCADPQLLGAPWRDRWEEVLGKGSLSALSALERDVGSGVRVPPWLRERMEISGRLLRGFSLTSSTDVKEPAADEGPELPEENRRELAGLMARRDLPGALRAARRLADAGVAGASEVAIVLSRLLAAAERAQANDQALSSATLPMEGPGLALLQVRMGNLDEAERGFRRFVLESPSDHVSREHLADLVALRRALGPPDGLSPPRPAPPPAKDRTPAPEWLDKKKGKAGVEGWAARPKPEAVGVDLFDDDPSTAVMRSDHEAELLLKAGHPERARQLYAQLALRFPDKPRFAERLAQIEEMIEEKTSLIASEPTVRKPAPSRDFGKPAAAPADDAFAPTPSVPADRAEILSRASSTSGSKPISPAAAGGSPAAAAPVSSAPTVAVSVRRIVSIR